MKTVRVSPNDEISIIEIPFTLDGFYEAIECDSIETVSTMLSNDFFKEFHEPIVMIVDEEGWLRDQRKVNRAASRLYSNKPVAVPGAAILGNVIFAAVKDDELVAPRDPDGIMEKMLKEFTFLQKQSIERKHAERRLERGV